MAVEIIRGSDLRLALSKLAQSAYGTALSAANLNAGKSFRPVAGIFADPTVILGGQGPRAFTGHEWAVADDEREVLRDLEFSLNFNANPFLVAWAAALALGSVTSVQEGVTGHYTHTIRPSDPLSSTGFQAKVTSLYLEAVGPDANRYKGIYPSLAVLGFTLTGRMRELAQMSVDLLGSGKVDRTTAVTLPALSSDRLLGLQWKVEITPSGQALVDVTERVKEWAFTCRQNVDREAGYVPNAATPADGRFRSQLRLVNRTFALTLALLADRSKFGTNDVRDWKESRTKLDIVITIDSGVVAGTGTSNHKVKVRLPECRLSDAPLAADDLGASFALEVPESGVYENTGVTDAPCTITVDDDEPSYLV